VRLSVDVAGGDGDGASREPSTSADARAVAYWSEASDLVAGDGNGEADVFVRDRGAASAFVAFCAGGGACPCANPGAPGHGCASSSVAAGARLEGNGLASLSADSARLSASGEPSTALTIVLQGDQPVAPAPFGDGLRCAGGALLRLYALSAAGGALAAPPPGASALSARAAELGAPIPLGATRAYQAWYRDPAAGFCPPPAGSTYNASNAVAIAWGP